MGFTISVATGVLLALPQAATAQEPGDGAIGSGSSTARIEVIPYAAEVPWGVGEYLEYEVDTGWIGGGSGFMAVEAVEDVRGRQAYRLNWYIKGSIALGMAKINQHNYSWFDVENLTSLRYIREDVDKENGTKHYEIYPDEYFWEVVGSQPKQEGELASALPLDMVSFIYYIRQMDLEVGREYQLSRYFKEDGNPVRLKVLRNDRRTTDAGTFNTIVVRPIIPGERLFDEDAKAEIHFSDDEARRVVYMKSETGILGISIELKLKSIVSEGQAIYGEPAGEQRQ